MSAPTSRRRIRRMPDVLHVVQLPVDASIPTWTWENERFVSVTRTDDEISIITTASQALDESEVAGPYVCFCVDEQLDFVLTGVIATLLQPLEELNISTLALSTYNTDWLLVPSQEADDAVEAWRRHGHTVIS